MTSLSQMILTRFQTRMTTLQKEDFHIFLFDELEKKNITARIEDDGKFYPSKNIIIGDLESSQVIFTAHYDTASILPVPNLLFPKNILANLLYAIFLGIILSIFLVLFRSFFGLFIDTPIIRHRLSYISFAILLFLGYLRKPNHHTANDNTSGVITALEILERIDLEESKACIVLFDLEESGLFGSRRFKKKRKRILEDKLIVNFDCVSDGDHLLLIQSRSAREEYSSALQAAFADIVDKETLFTKSSTTLFPSDHIYFKKHIGVMACHRLKIIGYYLSRIHTRRDTVFDERNISVLADGFAAFAKSISAQ